MEKTIDLIIKTGSNEQSISKLEENLLKVELKSRPVQGKANKELMEVLSYFFGVPKTKIEIVRGIKSKKKTVKVELYESESSA